MDILEKPRYDSWLAAERKLRATRDLTMKVSLPKLKCLEPMGVAPPSEEQDDTNLMQVVKWEVLYMVNGNLLERGGGQFWVNRVRVSPKVFDWYLENSSEHVR